MTNPAKPENVVSLTDLFDLADIQRLQDEFAAATGVASVITRPDGTPITVPSRFTRLCSEIVRKTAKGCANCYKSDAVLGAPHPEGPIVQPCLSGGLWDAGASISVGGRHIANWLIGQVRNDTQSEAAMLAYAREIGADEQAFLAAFREVPSMSETQFRAVAQVLFTVVNQLSTVAYQNVQQARFITERRRAEQLRLELERKLRQAQKDESLARMAGAVAHNFNNKLYALLGNLELALSRLPQDSNAAQSIAAALHAGRRATELGALMLTYLGQTAEEPEPVDLSVLCRQCLPALRAALPGGLVLEDELPGRGPVILGAATQLKQVLTNLVTNAREACGEKRGVIRVAVRTVVAAAIPAGRRFPLDWQPGNGDAYACLEVKDNGCGIAEADLEEIFDPFFSTKFTGRGLGLAVVLGVVRAFGGVATVESQPGRGSIFRVFLPLS